MLRIRDGVLEWSEAGLEGSHVGGKSIKSGSAEGTVRSSADSTEPSVEKVVRQVGGMCWHQSVPKEPSERVVR